MEMVFLQIDMAAKSVAALAGGEADVGFMAIDPLRAETTQFTSVYVQIEGFYLVPAGSPIKTDVDCPGTRIVMGADSACGLYLTRNIQQAEPVQVPTSDAVVDAMLEIRLEVAAGVKRRLEADARRERHDVLDRLGGPGGCLRMGAGQGQCSKACQGEGSQQQGTKSSVHGCSLG